MPSPSPIAGKPTQTPFTGISERILRHEPMLRHPVHARFGFLLRAGHPEHQRPPLVAVIERAVRQQAGMAEVAEVRIELGLVVRPQPLQALGVGRESPAQVHLDRQAEPLRQLRRRDDQVLARRHVHGQQVAAKQLLVGNHRALHRAAELVEQRRPVRDGLEPLDVALGSMPVHPERIVLVADQPQPRLLARQQTLQASHRDALVGLQAGQRHGQDLRRRRLGLRQERIAPLHAATRAPAIRPAGPPPS